MRRCTLLIIVVLVVSTPAPSQSCPGPNNTKWSTSQQNCVDGVNTSCDSIAQDTCFYALIEGGGWFAVVFVVKRQGWTSDHCYVVFPAILAAAGVKPGDRLETLNRRRVTPSLIALFNQEKPKTFRVRYHRADSLRRRVGRSYVVTVTSR